MTLTRRLLPCLLTITLLALPGVNGSGPPVGLTSAFADDAPHELRLGDDVKDDLPSGATVAYGLTLTAGSTLDIRLDAERSEEAHKGDDGGGTDPTLVLLSPTGTELVRDTGTSARLRTTVTGSGRHVIEVRSSTFSGSFELNAGGSSGKPPSSDVDVVSGSVSVPVAAPVGATVRIDVRRRSGEPPHVVAVRDAAGRELGYRVRRETSRRTRIDQVPVTSSGGLVVEISGRHGGAGAYDVRVRVSDEDDGAPFGDDDREARHIVLEIAPGTDPVALAAALGYELESVGPGYVVLETPAGHEGHEDDDALDATARFPEVLGGGPDQGARIPEGSQSNAVVLGSDLGRTAYERQPALLTVRAAPAHRRATGAGVIVAVLDTGIDASHPDFAGRLVAGYDVLDGDADPSEVADGIDNDGDGEIDEGFGHGTFVASLVLAAAPDARVMAVRVLDSDGRGRASQIADGIYRAVADGARIVNLSLGVRARSAVLASAVRFALSHGVTVVTSTGNAADTVRIDFPGGVPGVVSVTAVDQNGRLAPFANAGGRTTLAAPGVDLIGAYPNERSGTWSGTSFAAALVSGGAALTVERHPTWNPAQVLRRLRQASKQQTGVPRAERRLLGRGRLDLSRAVR